MIKYPQFLWEVKKGELRDGYGASRLLGSRYVRQEIEIVLPLRLEALWGERSGIVRGLGRE